MQRVPNDGDCFFSSIKAALPEGGAIDRARGLVSGGAAAVGAGAGAGGSAVAGKGLTVAEMREWVAEETGQDQLEFYILQAGANLADRWWADLQQFSFSSSAFSGFVWFLNVHTWCGVQECDRLPPPPRRTCCANTCS